MTFRLNLLPAIILVGALIVQTPVGASAAAQEDTESLIIHTDGSLSSLRAEIESLGGTVTYSYDNLNAVAAEMTTSGMNSLHESSGSTMTIMKDTLVAAPGPISAFEERGSGPVVQGGPLDNIPFVTAEPIVNVQAFANTNPGAYDLNHLSDNVLALHQGGFTGVGAVVAVVDTGLRPGFGNFAVADCVNLTQFIGDPKPCNSAYNDGHGTMVSGMIADRTQYTFDPFSVFLNSVVANAPGAALDLLDSEGLPAIPGDGVPDTVAAIGSAPGSEILMFKVFADSETTSPASLVLFAVDQIIQLKNDDVFNIQVANLSLGQWTLYAGKSPLELAVDALLANGIIPVASAGNTGPALLTTANPASSNASIAVGAGSQASQERVALDVNFCPVFLGFAFGCFSPTGIIFPPDGIGKDFRPFNGAQTAWFSARGPNADGRSAPDIMADGFMFGAGLGNVIPLDPELPLPPEPTGFVPDTVSIASGTSFSAPTVSGIAALLRQQSTGASSTQIRNAIVESGNQGLIADGSTEFDQGNGWVDADAASILLATGSVSDSLPRPPHTKSRVRQNLRRGADLRASRGRVGEDVTNLGPGQRNDILYEVRDSYELVQISLSNVVVLDNPVGCVQNTIFGEDEIRLAWHTAKTSAFPPAGFYYDLNPSPSVHAFISAADLTNPSAPGATPGSCGDGSCNFVVERPEPGFSRISLSGATENGCEMSAHVSILPIDGKKEKKSASGKVSDGEFVDLTMKVPSDVDELEFKLSWDNDWSRYPTNDLDLEVFLPSEFCPGCPPLPILQSLDSPERFVMTPEFLGTLFGAPEPIPLPEGDWDLVVAGFEVNEKSDKWEVLVNADGKKLKVKKAKKPKKEDKRDDDDDDDDDDD